MPVPRRGWMFWLSLSGHVLQLGAADLHQLQHACNSIGVHLCPLLPDADAPVGLDGPGSDEPGTDVGAAYADDYSDESDPGGRDCGVHGRQGSDSSDVEPDRRNIAVSAFSDTCSNRTVDVPEW
jgi:hypothetical protein